MNIFLAKFGIKISSINPNKETEQFCPNWKAVTAKFVLTSKTVAYYSYANFKTEINVH